jgi:hypothetical protein
MSVWSQCSPRVISVSESCGCTLTRASITGITPAAFEALGTQEIDFHRLIGQAAEARMIGVPERPLRDLLMSNIKNIKGALGKEPVQNQSVILPFIYRNQRTNVNSNYFSIESGVAPSDAGTGSVPAHAWDLKVNTGPSPFKSPLQNIQKYFLPGQTIFVLTLEDPTGTKIARTLQYQILRAVNADSGGVAKATVTVVPNYTASGFAALSSGEKAVYHPTTVGGTVLVGANSVSDYESWCNNENAENNRKLLTYWLQTSRDSTCYNDEYLKALNAAYTSEYFKKFRELPLAEQNRLQRAQSERKWLNSVFYGQRINENQSPETYTSLPQVTDIEDSSCVYEYKSNALGIRTQLGDCSRITDQQGAALDLDFVFEMLYNLKRNREVTGGSIDVIDAMTDRLTADSIRQLMSTYYKAKYGVDTMRYYTVGQKLEFNNQVLFNYDRYQVPEVGVELAVFHDPYFNDHLAAFTDGTGGTTNIQSRGRKLWFLDWSDISIGIAGTNSVKRNYPDANTNALYKCVITPNVKHYELRSTKWTVMVEDPNRHAIVENFSDACPTLTVAACTVA